jgi:hypothetical protein
MRPPAPGVHGLQYCCGDLCRDRARVGPNCRYVRRASLREYAAHACLDQPLHNCRMRTRNVGQYDFADVDNETGLAHGFPL